MNSTLPESPAPSFDPMLTRQQVGRILKLRPETVSKLELRAVRINLRVVRYRPCDVQAFIDAMMTGRKPADEATHAE